MYNFTADFILKSHYPIQRYIHSVAPKMSLLCYFPAYCWLLLERNIVESIDRYFPLLSKTNCDFRCIIWGPLRSRYYVGINMQKVH